MREQYVRDYGNNTSALTELYGELLWSASWSIGVWIGEGKWTFVRSGSDPVLLPIGICMVPGSCADG